MSLYRRQSFTTRLPDLGQITDRQDHYTAGLDSAGDGKVLCSRITLQVRTDTKAIRDQFLVDCGKLGVRVSFVQGVGKCHKKYRLWPLMAYSCSGPSQSLEILSRKDYIDRVGGHFKGRMLEDVAIPRPAVQTGYARDGFVNQRREAPVPREARRVVKPDLPNAAGVKNPPVDKKGRRVYTHPLPLASEFTRPMRAAGRVVTKMGKMSGQVKAGRVATAAQVAKQHEAEKLADLRSWYIQN